MDNKPDLVISYLELRRTIGVLAMSYPFIIAGGAWLIFSIGLQESISAYYTTPMRDLSVGLMFFMTGFLWSYKGYERSDEIAGKLATVFGWLGTIFPHAKSAAQMDLIEILHFGFSAALFVTLIYFSAFLFTRTQPGVPPTPQKLRRNLIYRICAVVMGVALGLGLTFYFIPSFAPFRPLFWGETLSIEAFGVSWFVKGEGILKDDE